MSRLLIQFSDLFKSFGAFALFEGISLSIHQGEVFALIGENGAGKTTLLQFLAGVAKPDEGKFSRASGLSIGFLPQEVVLPAGDISARAYIEEGVLSELERQMAACSLGDDRWIELHERYEELGGYKRVPIEKILRGLKLDTALLDLPMAFLSSGQRVRMALAKALMENPDLLLLDEPTNHLDVEMLRFLEEMLAKRTGATVIISHDRKFLNATCNRLIEIKNGKLSHYGGNYDFYLKEQERLFERQMKAHEAQAEERALLKQKIKSMTFSRRRVAPPKDRNIMAYDARGEKHQKSLARNLEVLKMRLSEIEANPVPRPQQRNIAWLKFQPAPFASSVLIELQEVCGFNKTICKGDRIILTGPNGSGKTTLLRYIAGLLPVGSGQIRVSPTTKIAYLDQEVALLPMERTPLEYFGEKFGLSEEDVRRELHGMTLDRPFSTLSVGQRKRLMLFSLILEKPNVLLLDEPTNHLDFLTLEAFEMALLQFEGAILAISHDSTFLDKIATQEWKLKKCHLTNHSVLLDGFSEGASQKEGNDEPESE